MNLERLSKGNPSTEEEIGNILEAINSGQAMEDAVGESEKLSKAYEILDRYKEQIKSKVSGLIDKISIAGELIENFADDFGSFWESLSVKPSIGKDFPKSIRFHNHNYSGRNKREYSVEIGFDSFKGREKYEGNSCSPIIEDAAVKIVFDRDTQNLKSISLNRLRWFIYQGKKPKRNYKSRTIINAKSSSEFAEKYSEMVAKTIKNENPGLFGHVDPVKELYPQGRFSSFQYLIYDTEYRSERFRIEKLPLYLQGIIPAIKGYYRKKELANRERQEKGKETRRSFIQEVTSLIKNLSEY